MGKIVDIKTTENNTKINLKIVENKKSLTNVIFTLRNYFIKTV